MLKIRKFEPLDAENVSAVVRRTMRISNGSDYPPSVLQPLIDYFSPEKLLQLNLERECLVAEIGNEILGTISLEEAQICTFFVLPEHQQKGVGTRLLKEIERIAGEKGIQTISLESSITAAPFYEKMGYRRTGKVKAGASGKQIGMEKTLLAL